jgi:hypothetical protein
MSFRQELPLNLFRKMMCGVVALLSIGATSAQAVIVFQDNFNRVGPLNGSTPSLTAGSNWTANPGFATDGTKVNAAFGFDNFTTAAYVPLPVAITSGNVYTLSATMHRGLSTDNTANMKFGFFDATPSWNAGVAIDEGHAIAISLRNNLGSVNTNLHGFVNASDTGVADGTDGTTFGVRLYETAPNTWWAVALELAPTYQLLLGQFSPTPISLTNTFTIGMISSSLLPPYIDDFTLDVTPVPEPSTFSLLACSLLAGCGLALKRRRNRKAQG